MYVEKINIAKKQEIHMNEIVGKKSKVKRNKNERRST